jgi:hypothetical protein
MYTFEGKIRPVIGDKRGAKSRLAALPTVTISQATFKSLASSQLSNTTIPLQLRVVIQRIRSVDDKEQRNNLYMELAAVPSKQANIKPDVVQMDQSFMEAVGFHPGDEVRIHMNKEPDQDAREIVLERLPDEEGVAAGQELNGEEAQSVLTLARGFVSKSTLASSSSSSLFLLLFLFPL